MRLFSNKLFLGWVLIVCLILTFWVYFIIDSMMPIPAKIPENTAMIGQPPPKNNTAPKAKDNTTESAATIYHKGTTIPKLTEKDLWVAMMLWHKGPQTVEALMESYHVAYLQSKRHRKIDERVPPEQWLQSVLDKGYTILNYGEYVQYMDARTVTDRLDNLEIRQLYSEEYGIPVSEIDRIKKLYLENEFLFLQRKHAVERVTDEPISGGFFIGDKFLPFYRDRAVVYVQRHDSGAQYTGTKLNAEQRFNLIFRAVEPEGIEVIYIDELGNQLSEKPEPVTREEVRKMMAEGEVPPPKEWWDPDSPVPDAEDFEEFLFQQENTETDKN